MLDSLSQTERRAVHMSDKSTDRSLSAAIELNLVQNEKFFCISSGTVDDSC